MVPTATDVAHAIRFTINSHKYSIKYTTMATCTVRSRSLTILVLRSHILDDKTELCAISAYDAGTAHFVRRFWPPQINTYRLPQLLNKSKSHVISASDQYALA